MDGVSLLCARACVRVFQFCKHQEQDTLKDLFNQDDDHQELGNFYVKASYKEKVGSEETIDSQWEILDL